MTDKHAKAAAFDKAVGCLPDEMSTSDLGIFFHGVCRLFDVQPEEIAAMIVLIEFLESKENKSEEDAVANLQFESKKLAEMFRGDAD